MMNGNNHEIKQPLPIITANEWELALFEFLGKSGMKGKCGYISEVKPIIGASLNATVTIHTQIVDVTEPCRIDVTMLGKLLAKYFARQPRHWGLDLVPGHFGLKPTGIE